MGLSALALESSPVFPTYPNRMAKEDVTAGLVLPYASIALLGKGGAAATLLLVFMAVTSAMSAELVAVSSIFTYDVYQTYFKPSAHGSQLIKVSHTSVVCFAIVLASFSTALYYIGISMGYLYLLMGVIISSAVLPASLTLLWSQQSTIAATVSPPLGLCCALIAWLVTAKKEGGTLTVDTTGANNPMLAGNCVALLSPLVFIPIFTYILGKPQRYDWQSMMRIRRGDDDVPNAQPGRVVENIEATTSVPPENAKEKVDVETRSNESPRSPTSGDDGMEEEMKHLLRASTIARWLTVFLTLCLLILWPMPMYGSGYIFSKRFFEGWVSVAIFWLFCSAGCVVCYPLWEGRKTSSRVVKAVFRELTGKGRPVIGARAAEERRSASLTGTETQEFGKK